MKIDFRLQPLNVTHSFDALILGGGAAGLMCAIEAGKRGRLVAVLDHADRLGKKILISGGDAASALTGFDGAHQACCASAENQCIE